MYTCNHHIRQCYNVRFQESWAFKRSEGKSIQSSPKYSVLPAGLAFTWMSESPSGPVSLRLKNFLLLFL